MEHSERNPESEGRDRDDQSVVTPRREHAAIDAEHAALTGRGLVLSKIAAAPWGRYATFKDPDGNGWILREAPPAPH